jgi:thiol-disulfide isomerase/thioredoxin
MRQILPIAALLVFLAIGGCRTGAAPTDANSFRLVHVEDVQQLTDGLDSLAARAVVVNVWATWCGPCIQEFPEFIRYDGAMEDQLVEVRFLSVDDPSIRPRVVEFLRQRGWEEPSYLAMNQDVVQGLAFAAQTMWDGSIPMTFILTDGKVRDMWIGSTTYQLLSARVDRVLAAPPPLEAASL